MPTTMEAHMVIIDSDGEEEITIVPNRSRWVAKAAAVSPPPPEACSLSESAEMRALLQTTLSAVQNLQNQVSALEKSRPPVAPLEVPAQASTDSRSGDTVDVACPRCGTKPMRRRFAESGHLFFGCAMFPNCRGTREAPSLAKRPPAVPLAAESAASTEPTRAPEAKSGRTAACSKASNMETGFLLICPACHGTNTMIGRNGSGAWSKCKANACKHKWDYVSHAVPSSSTVPDGSPPEEAENEVVMHWRRFSIGIFIPRIG